MSTESRLPRVAAVASRCTPARASSTAWSSRSSVTATAPRRWASAASAASSASSRWVSATAPAMTAATSSTPGTGKERAQPPVRPPVALGCLLGGGTTRIEELPLGGIELVAAVGGPVERRSEPGAAVQLGGVAAARVPLARGLREVAVQPPALRVLLEPAAQPGPLAQQRLVGELRLAVAERDQALGGKRVEHVAGVELGDRHARPRVAVARQAQQDAPRTLAAVRVEPLVCALGQARDRAVHAAAALVGAQGGSARPPRARAAPWTAAAARRARPPRRPRAHRRAPARAGGRPGAPGARSRAAAPRGASARRARGSRPARATAPGRRRSARSSRRGWRGSRGSGAAGHARTAAALRRTASARPRRRTA